MPEPLLWGSAFKIKRMRFHLYRFFYTQFPGIGLRRPFRDISLHFVVLLTFWCVAPARAPGENPNSAGLAWRVKGTWHVAGTRVPIMNGDLIRPGSLLETGGDSAHSLTILLPDGQRILYECFLPEDCVRGFRVPNLYRRPEPLAAEMMTLMHAGLLRGNGKDAAGESQVPRDEQIATIDPQNHIEITGLATKLPSGRYSYSLQPLDRSSPRQSRLPFEKNGSSIKLILPSPGLFEIAIADQFNTLRISLIVAAVKPGQVANEIKAFHHAQEILQAWNEDYQGWPIHALQRAYLEALMLHINAPAGLSDPAGETEPDRSNVAPEPTFSPRPGVFSADTAVILRCETAGATIHYTVDGSQPFNTSPVYHAPIMVKGTALTIKAFSAADGRKDSAVVTGIFRIEERESK